MDIGDRCVVGDTFPFSISSSTFFGVLSNSVEEADEEDEEDDEEEDEEDEEEEEDAFSSLSPPLAVRTLSLAPLLLQSSSSPSMAAVCTVALTPFATAATAAA